MEPEVIGARCKRLREASDISIRQLANRAKVSISTITRLENGKPPNYNALLRICGELGIGISELLDSTPQSEWIAQREYMPSVSTEHHVNVAKVRYGRSSERRKLVDGEVSISDLGIGLEGGILNAMVLEIAGEGTLHSHSGQEELVFCLTGSVELTVGGTKLQLQKGDCACFWAGEPHAYRHISHERDDRKVEKSALLTVWTNSRNAQTRRDEE
ncbi:helix-turn-helix domain-containing protein [Candidatus Poribacteria bacterium]